MGSFGRTLPRPHSSLGRTLSTTLSNLRKEVGEEEEMDWLTRMSVQKGGVTKVPNGPPVTLGPQVCVCVCVCVCLHVYVNISLSLSLCACVCIMACQDHPIRRGFSGTAGGGGQEPKATGEGVGGWGRGGDIYDRNPEEERLLSRRLAFLHNARSERRAEQKRSNSRSLFRMNCSLFRMSCCPASRMPLGSARCV